MRFASARLLLGAAAVFTAAAAIVGWIAVGDLGDSDVSDSPASVNEQLRQTIAATQVAIGSADEIARQSGVISAELRGVAATSAGVTDLDALNGRLGNAEAGLLEAQGGLAEAQDALAAAEDGLATEPEPTATSGDESDGTALARIAILLAAAALTLVVAVNWARFARAP